MHRRAAVFFVTSDIFKYPHQAGWPVPNLGLEACISKRCPNIGENIRRDPDVGRGLA